MVLGNVKPGLAPKAQKSPWRRRGFTMLELILILVILGISAAIALPWLAPFSRGRKTADVAAMLVAMTRFAQDRAVTKGVSVRLNINEQNGGYGLTEIINGAAVEVPVAIAAGGSSSDGVTLAWEGASDAASQGYIQFDADGGHDIAVIRVSGSDGQSFLMGTNSATEEFRVVKGDGQ